jgi:COX assembly protein 2
MYHQFRLVLSCVESYHQTTNKAPDCEEIMTALDECHAKGFLYKAVGNCNDIKVEVNKCLAAERYDRAKRNRDQARTNRRRIEDIWAKERGVDQQPSNVGADNTGAAKQ